MVDGCLAAATAGPRPADRPTSGDPQWAGQVQPRGSAERGAAGVRLRGNNPPVNLIGVARMALRGGNLKWFLGGSVLTSLPCYYLLHQDIFRSQAL